MTSVVFQDQGADFPPIVTNFSTRDACVAYILEEVSDAEPHRMESATVEDARKTLASIDSFSMIVKNGSKYIWTIVEAI